MPFVSLACCFLVPYIVTTLADDRSSWTPAKNVFRARQLLHWEQSSTVEVYYAEFLLAQWVLDSAPWNAYHSGLAFLNRDTGERCLYDFSPVDTSSVMKMLMPEIDGSSKLAVLLGDYRLHWSNHARTQLELTWPSNYERFVRIGVSTGRTFMKFTDWVAASFAPNHSAFQPLEVADVNSRGFLVRSTMCHDFVTDGLRFLYDHGAMLRAEEHVFRDHIIMYATAVELVNSSFQSMRRWQRYLRQLELSLERIKKQFTFAREALIWNWRLHLPSFLHSEQQNYQISLAPPFLNYCYLPLALPPEVHDPFGEKKLCALGLKANTTNSTAPWPYGTLLTVEERLDRLEVFVSLFLVASLAALGRMFKASPSQPSKKFMAAAAGRFFGENQTSQMDSQLRPGRSSCARSLSSAERQALQVARKAMQKEKSTFLAKLVSAMERCEDLDERCQVLATKKKRMEHRKQTLEEEVQRSEALKRETEAKAASEEEQWTTDQRPSLEAAVDRLTRHRDAWQELCRDLRRTVVQHEHELKELREENDTKLLERHRLQSECLQLQQEFVSDAPSKLSDAAAQRVEEHLFEYKKQLLLQKNEVAVAQIHGLSNLEDQCDAFENTLSCAIAETESLEHKVAEAKRGKVIENQKEAFARQRLEAARRRKAALQRRRWELQRMCKNIEDESVQLQDQHARLLARRSAVASVRSKSHEPSPVALRETLTPAPQVLTGAASCGNLELVGA
eukprot:s1318_g3.t1